MINNVVLVGRMTRDAELRYTPSNVAVALPEIQMHQPRRADTREATVTLKTLTVSVKRTLLTVLSGASKLKIWLTGLRKAH